MGRFGRLGFLLTLAMGSAGVAACFAAEDEVDASDAEVKAGADVSQVLKSTLILDGGCTAAKVGPRHLLVAARCVAGKEAFAAGKKITFKVASGAIQNAAATTAAIEDAGADADSGAKAAAPKKNKSTKEATIEEVRINQSYKDKCDATKCALGAVAGVEAKDIAVILLDAELENIPTIPVDLDEVGEGDPLLAVGSGCLRLDGTPSTTKTVKVPAVPAKAVNHPGSPFLEKKQIVGGDLANGYVVTPGPAWTGIDSPAICLNDIGAPLFRATHAAVAGVTANVTTTEQGKQNPTTVLHTRVDTKSKVGGWLEKIGVEVVHSCSEDSTCQKRSFDGALPGQGTTTNGVTTPGTTTPTDAGPDALAPPPDAGKDAGKRAGDDDDDDDDDEARQGQVELGEQEPDDRPAPNDGSDYDAGPKKKKKKAASGCSASAPGTTNASSALVLGLGLAIAAATRRRRSRK